METFSVPALELLAAAPDAVLLVDGGGSIRWCNDSTTALFGYAPGELQDQPVEVLVPDASRQAHAGLRGGYERHPTARPMGRGRRLHGQRKDGSTFVLQIALFPLTIAGEHHTAAIARDMTDWMAAEQRIERAQHRQALAEDRERIARDLHDTVIQELFAAGMSLQAVVGDAQPDRVAQRLSSTIDTIDDIIRQIRGTIFRLQRPPEGADRVGSLEDVMATMANSLGFLPQLHVEGDLSRLSEEAAVGLEVVVREALSNIARHAEATSATVEIEVGSAMLRIRVADDGVGVPDPLPRASGLANLGVRATALGGSMELQNRPQGGTELLWCVPVDAIPRA
jgi:PAS domain S-box-containing protein